MSLAGARGRGGQGRPAKGGATVGEPDPPRRWHAEPVMAMAPHDTTTVMNAWTKPLRPWLRGCAWNGGVDPKALPIDVDVLERRMSSFELAGRERLPNARALGVDDHPKRAPGAASCLL